VSLFAGLPNLAEILLKNVQKQICGIVGIFCKIGSHSKKRFEICRQIIMCPTVLNLEAHFFVQKDIL